MRLLAALAATLCFALPAAAEIDANRLGAAHFVGQWSLDGPEGCESRDSFSFYASGAWAVTNGGGNPVEAIGTWALGPEGLTVKYGDLDDPLSVESGRLSVDSVEEARMGVTLYGPEDRRQSFVLDRCPP